MLDGIVIAADRNRLAEELLRDGLIHFHGNHAFGNLLQTIDTQFRFLGLQSQAAAFFILVALACCFVNCRI